MGHCSQEAQSNPSWVLHTAPVMVPSEWPTVQETLALKCPSPWVEYGGWETPA